MDQYRIFEMELSPNTETSSPRMDPKKSRCLSITLTVLKNTCGKYIITEALIDSGCSINCLDWGFVRRHNLPHYCLPTPVNSKNVDGSYNEAGIIKFITTIFIRVKGIVHQVLFHIINCGNEKVILGDPWLEKTNPLINWENALSTSQTTQTTLLISIKRTKLYKEPWPPCPSMPTSYPKHLSGRNLPTLMKTLSTTFKERW